MAGTPVREPRLYAGPSRCNHPAMNARNGRIWIVAVTAIVGFGGLGGCSGKPPATSGTDTAAPAVPQTPTREQLQTATVTGPFTEPVTLVDGRYEGPAAQPGAASRPSLTLLQPTIMTGDIDGRPPGEAVALLSSSTGGTGELTHVAVFAMREGRAQSLATAPVGDRVRVFRTWLERQQVRMDVIEAAPGEPACCPTQLTRKAYAWQDGKLAQVENAPVGSLSVNLLAATDWMLVEMDGQPLPEGPMPPTALVQYEKVTGFAGCNRYEGPLEESKPGKIAIGALTATRKACDAPANELEAQFLERLGRSNAYTFQAGRLLLSGPPDAQGVRHTLLFSR